ncbi:MAG: hypothetical protein ACF8SC_02910 [Phycisphaerales bacterium JB037]
MEYLWLSALGRFGLLAAVATLFACLLRRCGVPGGRPAASVAGGLLAGVLLGPMVLPAISPQAHATLFRGESEAQAELERVRDEHRRELEVLARTGVSPEAVEEHRAGQRDLEDRLAVEARVERARFQRPSRILAAVLLGVTLLGVGIASRVPRARRVPESLGSQEEAPVGPRREQGVVAAAMCSVILATLMTATLAAWLLGIEVQRAVAIGGFAAAGSAFSHLPMRWIGARGRTSGAAVYGSASLFFAAILIALTLAQGQSTWILAPAFGWVVGRSASTARPMSRRARRVLRALVVCVGVPTLVAWLVAQIDAGSFAFGGWAFVVASVLLAGCGHWIGAVLAIHAGGSDDLRYQASGWWLEAHARGVPITQACAAVACVAAGVLDPMHVPADAALAAGLLLAGLATDLSVPMLRRVFAWSNELS